MSLVYESLLKVPPHYTCECTNGVQRILEAGFKTRLEAFLSKFERVQQSKQRLPPALIDKFPYVDFPPYAHEIYSRKQDLVLLTSLLNGNRKMNVLEIGSWNGWLSKRLAQKGHKVLATDIFTDPIDGLESIRHHQFKGWTPVQADLSNPEVFTGPFQLIIFNHCIQFLPQPVELIKKYMRLLDTQGQMVLLGVQFRPNQSKEKQRVEAYTSAFEKKEGFKIHFYPCKGFVDSELLGFLDGSGFRFTPYNIHPLKKFLGKITGNKAGIYSLKK